MAKVSIIVPVYRAERVLSRCVGSILAQTCADFELILVDDGSPDGSGRICDGYADSDSRVKVIHKVNGGVSAARNTGLAHAQGEHILFVDSDDFVDPDYIRRLCENQADLIMCGMDILDEQGNVIHTKRTEYKCYSSKQTIDYPFLYRDLWLYSPYCKLLRGDIIRENGLRFPEGITWGEDGMFIADYLRYVDTVVLIDYVGYHYIKYATQETLSTKVRDDILDMISFSREYCVNRMRETAPQHYAAVKEVCTKDIQGNNSYFIRRLLYNTERTTKSKLETYRKFLDSPYVSAILQEPEKYYPEDPILCRCLRQPTAEATVKQHSRLWMKQKIRAWIYFKLYVWQPKAVKKLCRKLRKK